ncbi:hypothetical protein [Paraconexibacter sp.]|uniref:hypothetical protein n=1 Tax=Paraconexibacter sp. TaxID=2949640 RepID=UPI003567BCC7
MSHRSTNLRRSVVLGLLALGLLAPAAQAAPNQITIMQDDDALIYRDDATRDAAMRKMKGLGVDAIRVTILWDRVAENAQRTKALRKRFRKLGADDPRAYPRLNWDRYDRLVRASKTLKLPVYFNITGPGPKWGHAKAPKGIRSSVAKAWRPKEREFYKFVKAVGKRYSGKFRDENDGRHLIPRVGIWSLWNEPNQAGWLAPQWSNNKTASPQIYRKLWFWGRRALVSTGHGRDTIFVGETAPIGQGGRRTSKSAMRPKTFLRAFFCLDRQDKGCTDYDKYGPVRTAAFAHHPYTKKNSPFERERDPEALTLANIGELESLLDEAAVRGRIAPQTPIVSSEFGYETNPPDPHQGIPLADQSNNLVLGEFLTFNNPRIIGHSQFLLNDTSPVRKHTKNSKAYWFTYQSGLFNRAGTAKPAAGAWAFPFVSATTAIDPTTGSRNVLTWGFLRFRPNDLPPGFQDVVQLQFRPADGSTDWVNVGAPVLVTNGKGYFQHAVETPGPGALRAYWSGSQLPFHAFSATGTVG